MKKLCVGDTVIVTAGKWKGMKSEILDINQEYVVLKGVNMVKRAKKGQGIVEKEAPLHISNVALFNEKEGKAAKVAIHTDDTGKKVRIFKKTKERVGK